MVIEQKAVDSDHLSKKIGNYLHSLDIDYKNISYYILSFIHRSIVNEKSSFTPEHNERLEFLGDAVLELVITDNLYHDFPKKSEGELTDIRSALVRGSNLAKVATKLGFSEYLLMGKGEEKSGGRENNYILANTVEAFLGAIYIDLGSDEARKFIDIHIYPSLDEIIKYNLTKDFKTLIQEYAQAEYDITPTYDVISEDGPDHSKVFEVGVLLLNKNVGVGTGTSKKKAQEKAAEIGYMEIKKHGFTK